MNMQILAYIVTPGIIVILATIGARIMEKLVSRSPVGSTRAKPSERHA